MSVSAQIELPSFVSLSAMESLDDFEMMDMGRFVGNAAFWFLVPTLLSPERPDSDLWPALTGIGAAAAASHGTMPAFGTALGLGAVTALWLVKGDTRFWR